MAPTGKEKKAKNAAYCKKYYYKKVKKQHEQCAKATLKKQHYHEWNKSGIAKGGSGESKQASSKSDELSHMEKWRS